MKVIAFNGSPRKNGNTSALINMVLDELKREGIETELVQLGGRQIHGCRACFKCLANQDRRCAQDDDVLNEFLAKMIEADGMILGSPTYHGDITAELKALIDRAGMKEQRVGGAHVSEKHANFILADKGAKATDVLKLINIVREAVYKKSEVYLELEIEVW